MKQNRRVDGVIEQLDPVAYEGYSMGRKGNRSLRGNGKAFEYRGAIEIRRRIVVQEVPKGGFHSEYQEYHPEAQQNDE